MTPWMVACQDLLSMEFFRQECWSGLPFPSPGIFFTQRTNLCLQHLLCWQADSLALAHFILGTVESGSWDNCIFHIFFSSLRKHCLPLLDDQYVENHSLMNFAFFFFKELWGFFFFFRQKSKPGTCYSISTISKSLNGLDNKITLLWLHK